MRLLARIAPILVFSVFVGPAGADQTAFIDAPASTGEHVSLADGVARERYQLTVAHDRTTDSGWYGFLGGDFERERSAASEFRGVLSAGSGYQVYDNDTLRLSLQGGLSYTEDALSQDDGGNHYPGLNWGVNWEQTFFDQHLNFFHRHRGNQELGSSHKLIINTVTGLSVPLAPGFSATARYDLEWDRSPRDQHRSADHIYTFGLGYDW